MLGQSLLSPLPKQLLYGKEGGLTLIIPPAVLSWWLERKEPMCPQAGLNPGRAQSIKGVVGQRQVRERQTEAGTRVGTTVWPPSAGATPRVRGSGAHQSAEVAKPLPWSSKVKHHRELVVKVLLSTD